MAISAILGRSMGNLRAVPALSSDQFAACFSGTPFLTAPMKNSKKQATVTTPKRPPNAFNLFVADVVKHRNKDETVTNVVREAGKQFKELSPADRNHYNLQALKLKTDFQKENEANTRPKKAFTPFVFYVREQMAKRPQGVAVADHMKEISAAFHKLSDGEKKRLEKLSNDDKERYKKELADFETRHPPEKKLPSRSPSAYHLFLKEFSETIKGSGRILSRGAESWRNMTEEQKKKFVDMAAEEKSAFEKLKKEIEEKKKPNEEKKKPTKTKKKSDK